MEQAIQNLRAALSYDQGNFDYQLTLARALRDSGHTGEAETYLVRLWETSPQDGAVNLALARLCARENEDDKATQYYHNAIYGVWPSESDTHRREVRIELVRYLLQRRLYAQAQSELIALEATLSSDPSLRLTVANLFFEAQDYPRALDEYRRVLHADNDNPQALAGAGKAAFRVGHFATAEKFLHAAVQSSPQDAQAAQNLETARLVLQSDPFARRLSRVERVRRVRDAFAHAGERLDECLASHPEASAQLREFQTRWREMKPGLIQSRAASNDLEEPAMDLVFQIEELTGGICGAPTGLDQALLVLSQTGNGAEQ